MAASVRILPVFPHQSTSSCAIALVLFALCSVPASVLGNGEDLLLSEEAQRRASRWLRGQLSEVVWRGDAELGYLAASGNTNTESAHTRWRVQNDRPEWAHTFRAEALVTRDGEETASQRYQASQKTAYKLTLDDYVFETVRFDRNESQGFRYRWSEVIGYGRRVLRAERAALYAEIGPGARQTRRLDHSWQREGLAYVSAELDWNPAPTTNFNSLLVVEAGDSNTLTTSLSSLTTQIANRFSARLSYEVTHNSDVPPEVERTDRTTSVTLVYRF